MSTQEDKNSVRNAETFKQLLACLAQGQTLTSAESEQAFDIMLEGLASPAQMGAFLMALRQRGETVEEIIGAVRSMRARMVRVNAPANALDIVGTGGDGSGSYNVSTLAALITASCGVPIAKHGNRAASSRAGTADVLAALGVKIGLSAAGVEACLHEAGIGFMMAPNHHAAMRHVGPVRSELGTRTIFNLLGPLCNPAGVKRQLLGVFAPTWLKPLAEVLKTLGSKRVYLVHGADNLDEISTTGTSSVVALEDGELHEFTLTPEDIGLARVTLQDLKGGDAAHNADMMRAVLSGARHPFRDIGIFNAAAALMVAEKVATLQEGALMAADALDSGATQKTLAKFVAISNAHA